MKNYIKKVKALAFFRDESISEVIRTSLRAWIDKRIGKKEESILSAKDEKEVILLNSRNNKNLKLNDFYSS